jgi:hypothetical protein
MTPPLSPGQASVLAALTTAGGWHDHEHMALRVGGMTPDQAHTALVGLVRRGLVRRRVNVQRRNVYRAVD